MLRVLAGGEPGGEQNEKHEQDHRKHGAILRFRLRLSPKLGREGVPDPEQADFGQHGEGEQQGLARITGRLAKRDLQP